MICNPQPQHPHSGISLCTIPEGESLSCFVPTQLSSSSSSSLQPRQGRDDDDHRNSNNENDNDDTTLGHQLVNQSRMAQNMHRLERSHTLDLLAQEHAEHMAERGAVYHSVTSIEALQAKLKRRPEQHVGENVSRGRSITQMHHDTTLGDSIYDSYLKDNILSDVFFELGIGMSRGTDGYLYVAQLFQ